ncbi:hypothetical protein [Roseibium sp.]|uniref:hypothetical protein n=1 Tax=Roseibium sp. TaxID=1936156 RepID=UPI003D12F82A
MFDQIFGNKFRRILLSSVTSLLVVGAVVGIYRHISHADALCASLDVDRVRWETVTHLLENYGGEGIVSVIGENGNRETYPIVQFSDPEEYLEFYPDCCRYYPGTLSGKPLSLTERYIDGLCGFVGISVHFHYSKNDQTVTSRPPSSMVWVVDNSYKVSEDLKGR